MKKLFVIAAVAAVAAMSSCCNGSKSLKNEDDSLAYVIGLDMGNSVKNLDSTLNVNIMAAAIRDALNNKPKMDQEQAYAFGREYFMVRKPAKALKESEAFLAKVEKENKNIQKTESGLMYEIITPGSTTRATNDADVVRVMYSGTLPSGKVFDSSYERGDTAEFALNRVIKGWSEGLKLVGEGGHIKLWIPSELAYGAQGAGQSIGPNQAICFDVELFTVTPAPAEEEQK